MAFLDGLGSALKSLDCFVLSQGDYIFGSLNALQGLDQGLAANVINGARRLRGCGGPDIEPPPPPFTGGQCPVTYNVQIRSYNFNQWGAPGNVFQLPGPLSIQSEYGEFECTGGAAGLTYQSHTMIGGDGQERSLSTGCHQVTPSYEILLLERVDGQPDTCGDPPSQLPPATNIDIDVDVEYVDEGDNIVNVTVPITVRPFNVNFNGDVSFPFEFNLGGIDFNGDVTFAPDFSLSVRGPKFPRGVNDSEGGGEPGNDRPPAAPEALIVGAVVVTTSVAQNAATSIEFVSGPDTFAPRLGSVKFAYSLGAATFWSEDINVKGRDVFIPCPFSQGADAVAGTPVPGVEFSVTPIFGFPLATIGDIKAVLDVV